MEDGPQLTKGEVAIERCDPASFRGPRAYFTAFDYRIIKRHQDQGVLKQKIIRRLKSLLLSKGFIVCAASHLTSDLTYSIFLSCPSLLTEKHVIPALRADKDSIAELFTRDRSDLKSDKIDFYEEHITKTVSWNLEDNSKWFRQRFIEDMANPSSLIRSQLRGLPQSKAKQLIANVKEQDILSRDTIEHFAASLPKTQKDALLNYRELIYHISGARVVNCEGHLPQEEYIDYDLADIEQKRVKLTEAEILVKLLIETVLDSLQTQIMSVELLDKLSLNDVVYVRKPLTESAFQHRYDSLINGLIANFTDQGDSIILDAHQLESLRNLLQNTFQKIVSQEIPLFTKTKKRIQSQKLYNSMASFALGLLQYIPILGKMASAGGMIKDTRSLIFNINSFITNRKSFTNTVNYVTHRNNYLTFLTEKYEINDKAMFISFVDLLCAALREKYRI